MGVIEIEAQGSARRHGGRYIYEALRRQILTLQLKPGAQLDEVSLATQFKLSRSPVRDALARLISEGLVSILPNRTLLVTPFEIEAFPDYIAALDLTQRAVTRLAALNHTEQDLQRIRQANGAYVEALGKGSFEAMSELNKAFHLEIARAGHNPYFTRYYEKLLGEGQRLLHLQFDFIVSSQGLSSAEQDHDGIIDAIANRQADLAERASHEHTMLFRDRFLEFMKQNLTQGVSIR
ncbi:GntR family transcriptional regulator [Pseudomonas argentinensis]|uniref:DNA-binding transcriptional regulator, GntR family n=1 Tax=Phytopseudomonas argentinensis TaxID=289370 RepID=A0A1I3NK61_9GAMM|nr:GntR family transcriptional regulator [Pseudomonas argentinensis]KAB0549948.1 GntR family transcriptional regulator [Pseudomonas argentinensis]SFJ09116.1 DNA-binding transcriptional regulator, GntR family [Pseudomonas argentinensis]